MATATPPLAVVCYRFSWTLTAHRVLPPPCTPVRLHSPREINMQEAAPGRPLPISPFPTISPCAAPFFFNPAPIALLSALFCLPSTLPYRSSPLCPSAPPNIPSGCVPTLFATPVISVPPPLSPLLPPGSRNDRSVHVVSCLPLVFARILFAPPPLAGECWRSRARLCGAPRSFPLSPRYYAQRALRDRISAAASFHRGFHFERPCFSPGDSAVFVVLQLFSEAQQTSTASTAVRLYVYAANWHVLPSY